MSLEDTLKRLADVIEAQTTTQHALLQALLGQSRVSLSTPVPTPTPTSMSMPLQTAQTAVVPSQVTQPAAANVIQPEPITVVGGVPVMTQPFDVAQMAEQPANPNIGPSTTPTPSPAAPTPAQTLGGVGTFTITDVRERIQKLAATQGRDAAIQLLTNYNAAKVTDLLPDTYAAVCASIDSMLTLG